MQEFKRSKLLRQSESWSLCLQPDLFHCKADRKIKTKSTTPIDFSSNDHPKLYLEPPVFSELNEPYLNETVEMLKFQSKFNKDQPGVWKRATFWVKFTCSDLFEFLL
jgi:hypothetical protein